MACPDCFSRCGDDLINDECVKYTGPDIPLLEICTGDSLSIVEAAIITKLLSALNGTGILLSDLTIGCTALKDILAGQDKTLVNILQMLISSDCALRDKIADLEEAVANDFSFNTDSLDIEDGASADAILQAVIDKLEDVETRLEVIEGDYVKATQLNTLIAQYNSSQATSVVTQYSTKLVPFIAYEYYGPLSNFDSSGAGLTAKGFEKVYLCNGANGTPDKRGRTAVGAIANVPGPALDVAVDPALTANAGRNYALKEKFGTNTETLNTTQIPSHTHVVDDPGHKHQSAFPYRGGSYKDGPVDRNSSQNDPNLDTSTATTGITIKATGGSQPHNNVQPSIGAYFIMFVP